MGMNNVYYRFLHLVEDEEYGKLPARLRMNVIGNPGIDRLDFELIAWRSRRSTAAGLHRLARAQAPRGRREPRGSAERGAYRRGSSCGGRGARIPSGVRPGARSRSLNRAGEQIVCEACVRRGAPAPGLESIYFLDDGSLPAPLGRRRRRAGDAPVAGVSCCCGRSITGTFPRAWSSATRTRAPRPCAKSTRSR